MDDVEIAAGSADDLFGGARVEEAGVAAVAGGAEDEHGGMVAIAEFGDALPDAAVVAYDLEEIPGHGYVPAGHLLDVSRQRGCGCAFVFGVEDLVHGDVGLNDVEDLDRVPERLSDVGADSHDLVGPAAGANGDDDRGRSDLREPPAERRRST
jgi:hypothetical protein